MRCFKISYITSIPISRCNTNSNWVRGRLLSILLYLNKKKYRVFLEVEFPMSLSVFQLVGQSVWSTNQSAIHFSRSYQSSLSTGCSGKIVFFHNSLQPHPCIAERDLQSSQPIIASEQLLLLAGNFLYNK